MKTSVMIKELEFARSKEKNKKYPTFSTNYYQLIGDVIKKIKELSEQSEDSKRYEELGRALEWASKERNEWIRSSYSDDLDFINEQDVENLMFDFRESQKVNKE